MDPEDDAEGALSFRSLLEDKSFGSLEDMVEYDRAKHGVDLKDLLGRFGGYVRSTSCVRLAGKETDTDGQDLTSMER